MVFQYVFHSVESGRLLIQSDIALKMVELCRLQYFIDIDRVAFKVLCSLYIEALVRFGLTDGFGYLFNTVVIKKRGNQYKAVYIQRDRTHNKVVVAKLRICQF